MPPQALFGPTQSQDGSGFKNKVLTGKFTLNEQLYNDWHSNPEVACARPDQLLTMQALPQWERSAPNAIGVLGCEMWGAVFTGQVWGLNAVGAMYVSVSLGGLHGLQAALANDGSSTKCAIACIWVPFATSPHATSDLFAPATPNRPLR